MWPFRPRPILEPDQVRWHLENFLWLAKTYRETCGLADRQLVLPASGVYKTNGEEGHALAQCLFDRTKDYCGLRDVAVRLRADREAKPLNSVLGLFSTPASSYAAGTFSMPRDTNEIWITYEPNLLKTPERLIATFAHELAHVILAVAPERPPCAPDEEEMLTDLAAVYLGFGVFQANSAFEFRQFQDGLSQGWQMNRLGYLPEADLAFATAVFMAAKAIPKDRAVKYLKPHIAALLGKAFRMLEGETDAIARIRSAGGLPA